MATAHRPIGEHLVIEKPDEGLYLSAFTEVVTVAGLGDDKEYLVKAGDYMAVQKERDDYRKACALINAWRMRTPEIRDDPHLKAVLATVDLDDPAGATMNALIASVRSGDLG